MHVLYSFPFSLRKSGVGLSAWNQITRLEGLGVSVQVFCASLEDPLPEAVAVTQTCGFGKARLPLSMFPLFGPRLHDLRVRSHILTTRKRIDIFHGWPLGSEMSLAAAAKKGVPTLLENCNSHIKTMRRILDKEYDIMHIRNKPFFLRSNEWIRRQTSEYRLCSYLSSPSDFVRRSFLENGILPGKILDTQYGFDGGRVGMGAQEEAAGFKVLFLARGEPRKGLHYLLKAWNKAELPAGAQLLVAGFMEPTYRSRLERLVDYSSVHFLGFVKDPIELLRSSHVLVLPSVEEGSALVTYEARGAGCVVLASLASGAIGESGEGVLFHRPGDVDAIAKQLGLLASSRSEYLSIRAKGCELIGRLTWEHAGDVLLDQYRKIVDEPTGLGKNQRE